MRLLDYIFFCRPLVLIPVWTFFLLLRPIALPYHLWTWSASLGLAGLTALTAGAYVLNQLYDIESDRRNRKLGFFDPPVEFSTGQARRLYWFLTLGPILCAALLEINLLAPFVIAAALGWAYSAPPIRAKDRPILGLVFNAISFSAVIWWVIVAPQRGWAERLDSVGLGEALVLAAVFCAVAAVYVLTTIPDLAGDSASGKVTVAVKLGRTKSLVSSELLLGAVAVLSYRSPLAGLGAVAVVTAAIVGWAIWKNSEGAVLLAAKLPILLLTVSAGITYPWYLLFVLALIFLSRLYYRRRFGLTYPRLA
ncbi:MAG TPA: UbiA family prenyltransferase [candidate division Zixibacteria bacterium]|nr:UbiA family prenyltransferase [candidate division Zixibacteria bacterium]